MSTPEHLARMLAHQESLVRPSCTEARVSVDAVKGDLRRSASRLLPILHRLSARGWPGLSEGARTEATDALADLEALLTWRTD